MLCYAHQILLLCGELITKGKKYMVIADALMNMDLLNKSASKWPDLCGRKSELFTMERNGC